MRSLTVYTWDALSKLLPKLELEAQIEKKLSMLAKNKSQFYNKVNEIVAA